jgi:putative membrane protein
MKSVSVVILSLILAAGFGLGACNRSNGVEAAREPDAVDRTNTLTADDKEFIEYASEMHAGEIQMAELVKQKTSREDIKDYAESVIDNHKDALEELSEAAGQKLTLQNTKASLDTERHTEYLQQLSGAEFDREFIALMIADHKDAASTFNEPFVDVQNKKLKSFMKEELPALEQNLSQAEKLKK